MRSQTQNIQSVELVEKNRPQQQRAIRTYEAILSATGELLQEVGLERISTNNIAERAGVTVPALYRYFPNKYAVLNAMGLRLMEAQDEVFQRWQARYVVGKPVQSMLDSVYYLLYGIYDVTLKFPGGLEVMHGMQAMAPLQCDSTASGPLPKTSDASGAGRSRYTSRRPCTAARVTPSAWVS